MNICVFGLSITSSWGNGHATTYRALVKALDARGHRVSFFERNLPWYASNRDLPEPGYCSVTLYDDVRSLERHASGAVREADVVIVGSFVPDGTGVGEFALRTARGVTAFYDIDTPITLARLADGTCEYLASDQVPRYELYLSFSGGPALEELERRYGAPRARALHCSVDPELYYPEPSTLRWDLGYLGTYSDDRQPVLDRLMLDAARRWPEGRFIVAGPQYPDDIAWPPNVERLTHLSPAGHRRFYCASRFTMNVTRRDMVRFGFSPSVRLFEAAACGTPILSDSWPGLESFFTPGVEILVTDRGIDTLAWLRDLSDAARLEIGRRARARVLGAHTSAHRAIELESLIEDARGCGNRRGERGDDGVTARATEAVQP